MWVGISVQGTLMTPLPPPILHPHARDIKLLCDNSVWTVGTALGGSELITGQLVWWNRREKKCWRVKRNLPRTAALSLPKRQLVRPIKLPNVTRKIYIVQELCESRGGRPGLSVLTSLLVSVDVKIYCTVLRHWSQLVPNMSHDIWGH